MPRDDARIYNARPTVRVAGLEAPVLDNALHSMLMRESVGGLSSLELTLVDWTSAEDGRAGFAATGPDNPLKLGADIEIYAGDAGAPQRIFQGRITALESEMRRLGPPLMTVLAEDALFAARISRRRRTFEDSSPADVLRRIAEDHGLEADVEGLDLPVGDWAQLDETDLGFARRVIAAVDGDMQVVDGKLQAAARAVRQRTELTLFYPDDILNVRVTADLADQRTRTSVSDWDGIAGRAISADVEEGEFGPGVGTDGPGAMARDFGQYFAHVGDAHALTQEEAETLARAAHGARARRFVVADGTALGDPQLRVGSWITLLRVNPQFENAYVVVSATHRFDRQEGYVTDFIAECARFGDFL